MRSQARWAKATLHATFSRSPSSCVVLILTVLLQSGRAAAAARPSAAATQPCSAAGASSFTRRPPPVRHRVLLASMVLAYIASHNGRALSLASDGSQKPRKKQKSVNTLFRAADEGVEGRGRSDPNRPQGRPRFHRPIRDRGPLPLRRRPCLPRSGSATATATGSATGAAPLPRPARRQARRPVPP